ncbi:MAG: hypothetical protein AL399_02725 [Candidatus [Bacteroides] periocalifornicus]|uniref:Uncharacterized protein n=1 Tax=Candidatus [Bacteroides] periocalifornicus TaxID=1702214 RepID=A0A0Q4BAI4_9BACT|nr:MAG: hypothetical protein AL399_02725 [Candidatus [Bacteroides] periocalifornicus]
MGDAMEVPNRWPFGLCVLAVVCCTFGSMVGCKDRGDMEGSFNIRRPWVVHDVSLRGVVDPLSSRLGWVYDFTGGQRCQLFAPDGHPVEALPYSFSADSLVLRIGGVRYTVYTAWGNELVFGRIEGDVDQGTYHCVPK